jgi:predicted dehydrogenase
VHARTIATNPKAKDVDAVLIGSPTGFHAEQIQTAANNGKSLLTIRRQFLD